MPLTTPLKHIQRSSPCDLRYLQWLGTTVMSHFLLPVSSSVHLVEHHGMRVGCVAQVVHCLQRVREQYGAGRYGNGPWKEGAVGVAGGSVCLLPHNVAAPLCTRVLEPYLIGTNNWTFSICVFFLSLFFKFATNTPIKIIMVDKFNGMYLKNIIKIVCRVEKWLCVSSW